MILLMLKQQYLFGIKSVNFLGKNVFFKNKSYITLTPEIESASQKSFDFESQQLQTIFSSRVDTDGT
jgi:hypothetical protein